MTYDYVSSGVVKGSQQTVCLPDGSLDVRFQFIDRGRGPALHSTIALDDAGFISKLRTTGYNYMKVTVDERFVAGKGTVNELIDDDKIAGRQILAQAADRRQ